MKIAILSEADVSSMYATTLIKRGHGVMFGPFGDAETAVTVMIKLGIEGVLILNDEDENFNEIAERFTRETGRPIWRNLTDIPRRGRS